MDLGDDAIGVGVAGGVSNDIRAEAGAVDTLQSGVEPAGALGVREAGVVPVEDVAGVDLQHVGGPCPASRSVVQLGGLKRILQVTLVVTLTVVLLWLFLRNADFRAVGAILAGADPGWIALAIVANVLALLFRTMRWRILLDPVSPPPFYATFFANTVGYMLSSILPVRAADVARSALLSWRTTHRFSGALGTVLTERILDLMSVLLLFGYFAIRRWSEYTDDARNAALWNYVMRPSAVMACTIFVVLVTVLVGVYFFARPFRRLHERLGRLVPVRYRGSWMHFFDTFVDTLEILKQRAAFARVLLLTAGVWACLSSQVALSAIALDRRLPFDAAFFITTASTIGLAVPTPGGIGGAHKVVQFVLTRFYQFNIDSSVAAAVLFHLVGTLPVILIGLTLFAREGLHWRDALTGRRKNGESDESSG